MEVCKDQATADRHSAALTQAPPAKTELEGWKPERSRKTSAHFKRGAFT